MLLHQARGRQLVRRVGSRSAVGEHEHEIVVVPFVEIDPHCKAAVAIGRRVSPAGEGAAYGSGPPSLDPVAEVQVSRVLASELCSWIEHHLDLRGARHGDDPAQHHRPISVRRQRERCATLDHGVGGHPPASPDQCPILVVTASPRAIKPTAAPRRANSRATARPTPADAPVTTTTPGDVRLLRFRAVPRQP